MVNPRPESHLYQCMTITIFSGKLKHDNGNSGHTLHVDLNNSCFSLLQSCQTQCNGMTECRAFVFYRPGSSCIFYDNVGVPRAFTGFDYYRRRDSCDDGGNQRKTSYLTSDIKVKSIISNSESDTN